MLLMRESMILHRLDHPNIVHFIGVSFQSIKDTVGTPMYMAPELLRGDEHYNSSIDIYSYSILAYEIVTGKEPYYELSSKITSISLSFKIMKGYRPKLDDQPIPQKMKDLLSRCWDEQPEKPPTFSEICFLLLNDFTFINEEIDKTEFNEFIENIKYNEQINYFIPIGQTWTKKSYTHFCLVYYDKTYEVKSSSTFSGDPPHHSPNNLFDGKKEINNNYVWASDANLESAFIQITFGNPLKATVLSMTARDYWYLQAPNSFEIFGMNFNESLVSLRRFDNVSWSKNENKLFSFNNTDEFCTYKIIFYSRSHVHFGIAELNLGDRL